MPSVEPMAYSDLPMAQRIQKHLEKYLHVPSLYVDPEIPKEKLNNTRKSCNLSQAKRILGLVDIALYESTKNCLVFTVDGVYYHNECGGRIQRGAISYREFTERRFLLTTNNEISLDHGETLTLTESEADAYQVWEILESIRLGLLPSGTGEAAASDAEESTRGTLEDDIMDVLRLYHPQDSFYVYPKIPHKKLANARYACGIPQAEGVMGLIDCTVFGSAKNGLVFGTENAHYANVWTGKSRQGKIPYHDFPNRSFTMLGSSEISLDRGDTLVVSGSSMKKEVIIDLLRAIARRVHWRSQGRKQSL